MSALHSHTTRRFSGLARLYGADQAAALHAAHVAVIGIGGVGSWAAEALARSGVGTLTLVDMDHIAESNINRQIHALDATLGQSKVLAMQARIAAFAPQCTVHVVDDFVQPDNWHTLLPHAPDAVIDACDHMAAKITLAAWARTQNAPFITAGAAGGKQQAWQVEVGDLAHATHDPLLANLRNRLRKNHQAPKAGKKMGVACVFSRESVRQPTATTCHDSSLNCHGYGSSVTVTATFGLCAAGWVMQQLAQASAIQ